MSIEGEFSDDFFKIMGKINYDQNYKRELLRDPDKLDDFNISKKEREIIIAKSKETIRNLGKPIPYSQYNNSSRDNEFIDKMNALSLKVQEIFVNLLDSSFNDSRNTFKKILRMSYIVFGTGIILFFLAVVFSLIEGKEMFSIAFGAFGAINFIAFFIFRPINQVQYALSNLLQAETIFINFWDQVHFWADFGTSEEITKKQEASKNLHEMTLKTVSMFQDYLEEKEINSLLFLNVSATCNKESP